MAVESGSDRTPTGEGSGAYTPVFAPVVRTVVYIVCLIAGMASVVLAVLGYADVASVVGSCASMLAAGFGVAYNPMRSV